jgi:uncharacterized protein
MTAVILKATEACNSNCYYCDVVRKQGAGKSMSLEVLETVYRRIDEYLKEVPNDRLSILWHGGEPLLLGAAYFRQALELQRRCCPETQSRISHDMQTNLTLFDESFVEVFRELGITALGTSYDPEPGMRGPGRLRDSERYNRSFLRALRLVERHGFHWGMIYVVTRKSLARPLETFNFLTNLNLSGGFNLNAVLIYDEERKDIAITADEFADFLGVLFERWWKHRNRYPAVEPFRALTESIVEGRISLGCVDSGECTYHHVNVAPDGATSQCGRAADWNILSYGNLAERKLSEVLHDPQRQQLERRLDVLPAGECADCRFWSLCHGGCPLDAYSQHQGFLHKSEWCEAKRGFIERYLEPITGVRFEPKTS